MSSQSHVPIIPPQMAILQLINNLIATKSVVCMTKLSIPDLLISGPQSAQRIAEILQLNSDATYRLLRATAAVGVLDHLPDDTFSLNDVGKFLASSTFGYVANYVLKMNCIHPCYD